jgi:hypothetical protein
MNIEKYSPRGDTGCMKSLSFDEGGKHSLSLSVFGRTFDYTVVTISIIYERGLLGSDLHNRAAGLIPKRAS